MRRLLLELWLLAMTFCSNRALTQAGKLKDKSRIIMLTRANMLMLASEGFGIEGDKVYTCSCVPQGQPWYAEGCASGRSSDWCQRKVFDG